MKRSEFERAILELHEEYKESIFNSVSDFFEDIKSSKPLATMRSACPIEDTGEELVELPDSFRLPSPHPYQSLGAPYHDYSPWCVRKSILEKLNAAQMQLDEDVPGFHLAVYDAYRPVAVQEYMILLERDKIAKERGGIDFASLDDETQAAVQGIVYSIWAPASYNLKSPPPHSTGAAIDLTIVDEHGNQLPMGSNIDDYPPTSLPSFYMHSKLIEEKHFHENRRLLQTLMENQGFCRLAHEWWHFSYGDQQWVLNQIVESGDTSITATFGGISA